MTGRPRGHLAAGRPWQHLGRWMEDVETLKQQLTVLRSEHADLDVLIGRTVAEAPFNQLTIQRLKRRKLMLKDRIAALERRLLPDIIA